MRFKKGSKSHIHSHDFLLLNILPQKIDLVTRLSHLTCLMYCHFTIIDAKMELAYSLWNNYLG